MIISRVLRSGFQRRKTAEKLGVFQRSRSVHPVIFTVSKSFVTFRTKTKKLDDPASAGITLGADRINTMGRNNTVGSVMVVGAGIAGMQSALDLAESGYYVYLVEETAAIGGLMSQLDKTFPTNDCAM